jgi:XTP/dITP diphosphohydrolase
MDGAAREMPWEKSKLQTLRHLTIEETYELGDAILDNDLTEVKRNWETYCCILFLCQDRSETDDFDIADVCNEKVKHHPHILGYCCDERSQTELEKLKLEGRKNRCEGVLALPALVKASRIHKVKGRV